MITIPLSVTFQGYIIKYFFNASSKSGNWKENPLSVRRRGRTSALDKKISAPGPKSMLRANLGTTTSVGRWSTLPRVWVKIRFETGWGATKLIGPSSSGWEWYVSSLCTRHRLQSSSWFVLQSLKRLPFPYGTLYPSASKRLHLPERSQSESRRHALQGPLGMRESPPIGDILLIEILVPMDWTHRAPREGGHHKTRPLMHRYRV